MMFDENFYKNLLDNIYDAVYFIDKDLVIRYWNRAAEKLTGYTASEIVDKPCGLKRSKKNADSIVETCQCGLNCPVKKSTFYHTTIEESLYINHKDGHVIPVLMRISPVMNSNNEWIGSTTIFSDNSKAISLVNELMACQQKAYIDQVTQIANRQYMEKRIVNRLAAVERFEWSFGILFVDIDDFKSINDKYGHDIGDNILKIVSQTLLNCLRPFDLVGRWGGDEFVAILENIDRDNLVIVAKRLATLVRISGIRVDGGLLAITLSIGVTISKHNDTANTLLKRADSLMYQSKRNGKGQISID